MNHRFKSDHYMSNTGWKLNYLVSRLDGKNLEEVQDMIDRSYLADHTGNGTWILDGGLAYMYWDVLYTNDILMGLGFSTVVDYERWNWITEHLSPVIGYTSAGFNDFMPSTYIQDTLDFNYLDGAVFNTYESFNCWAINKNFRNLHGLVSEFVEKRLDSIAGTVGAGHTFEPFVAGLSEDKIFFPSYAMGYNLVDAAYQGMKYLAWQNVVVGDPLTTIAWGKQTLTQNTTLNGTNLVTGTITIPSGKTLTIANDAVINFKHSGSLQVDGSLIVQPGAKLNFNNNSSVIVNGTLTANGTSLNKITFDFIAPNSTTSNGIKVNFGGTLTLSNAIVKNAYRGIKLTLGGQTSSIQNSTVHNCTDGIFIQYGSKDADLTVGYCEIKNNSNFGICIFNKAGYGMNSEPVISNNNIESCNYGVYLNGNVGAIIQRSTIKNCTQGIYVYEGQPSILNNTILNPAQNGIYCNAAGKSPLVLGNTITKENNIPSYQNYQGIWIENNTSAYIAHNDISGFCWGIYCGGGVNSYFTDYSYNNFYPNNRLRDSLFGFAAGWGSYILAGKGMEAGWNNSVYNNERCDVMSYQYSTIYATFNYWGERPIFCVDEETSELYTDDPLREDPWREGKNYSGFPANPLPTEGGVPDIIKGILLEKEGKINDAIKHYKQMINKNSYAGFAITELAKFKKKYSVTNLPGYFGTLVSSNNIHKEKVLRIIAAIHLDENRYNEAMQTYNSIIIQYPNSRNAVYARFEKYYAALNHASDLNTAFQLLQEIHGLGLTDDEFLMKLELAEDLYASAIGSSNLGKSSTQTVQSRTDQAIPNDYALFDNYPNPFNPSTTISYALPFESEVSITIFDLTGRVIKTMNLNNQAAGNKTVMWDGKNDFGESVSSGVYICRFKAVSLEGNGKSFSKSLKLMLLK